MMKILFFFVLPFICFGFSITSDVSVMPQHPEGSAESLEDNSYVSPIGFLFHV